LHRDQKNSGIRRGALTSGGILGAAGAGLGAVIGGGVMPSKTKMGLKLGLAGAAVGAVSGGLSKLKRYNSHPELVDRDAINSIHRSAGHKDRTYAHVPGGSAEKSLDAILNHLPPKK